MVEGFGVVLGWVFYCGNGYVFERFWLGIGNKVVGVIGFCFGKFGWGLGGFGVSVGCCFIGDGKGWKF